MEPPRERSLVYVGITWGNSVAKIRWIGAQETLTRAEALKVFYYINRGELDLWSQMQF